VSAPHSGAVTERRTRPIGLGLALVGAGAAWLVSALGLRIPWAVVLPVALIAVGVLVVIGGRWAADGGLVGLGVALAIATLLLSLLPGTPSLAVGDRTIAVPAGSAPEDDYGIAVGTLTVDLSDAVLPEGTTRVTVEVLVGEVEVVVPRDVRVVGTAGALLGQVEALGAEREGVGPRVDLDTGSGARVLELDVRVLLGSVEVRR
jgi:hypothetical protein